MRSPTIQLQDFDLEAFSRQLLTRRNVSLRAKVLRGLLLTTLFLIIVLTTRFLVQEMMKPSKELKMIQSLAREIDLGAAAVLEGNAGGEDSERDSKFNRSDVLTIRNTKLFGITQKVQNKPTPAATTAPEGPVETPLPFNLIGTFVSPGGKSEAIIEEKQKSVQEVFKIGESVYELATLKAVYSTYVELERGGKVETLTLEDIGGEEGGGGGAAPAGAEEIIVNESELNTALDNLPLLLTQARAVPYFKEGKSVGLRLFAIKTGSLYDKIGLKNGDILSSINGKNLGDFSQAMKLFEQLREERNLTLELERNRKPVTYYYTIQ